jgi:hypothetical protein
MAVRKRDACRRGVTWCVSIVVRVPSVTQVEPRRRLHRGRNPAPAGDRERAGDD